MPDLSDQRPVTLGHLLRDGVDVAVRCRRCDHHTVVDAGGLILAMGSGVPVRDVGRQMRCTRCASRDIDSRPDWPTFDAA